MSFFASISCPGCGKLYDEETRRACSGTCNHSICTLCSDALEVKNCPLCRKVDAFKKPTINFSLMDVLVDLRQKTTEHDFEKFSEECKNLNHGVCSECNAKTDKLRLCVNCIAPLNIIKQGIYGYQLVQADYLSFIKAKNLAICSNCFIDYHEKHEKIDLDKIPDLKTSFQSEYALTFFAFIEQKISKEDNKVGEHQEMVNAWKISAFRCRIMSQFEEQLTNEIEGVWRDALVPGDLGSKLVDARNSMMETQRRKNTLHRKTKMDDRRLLVWTVDFFQRMRKKSSRFPNAPQLSKVLKEVLKTYPLLLTPEESASIDIDVFEEMRNRENWMKTVISKPVDEGENFFKFRVIKAEFEFGLKALNAAKAKLIQDNEDLDAAHLEKKLAAPSDSLSSMVCRKQTVVFETIKKRLIGECRLHMAELMMNKYFPRDCAGQDKDYMTILQELYKALNVDTVKSLHI